MMLSFLLLKIEEQGCSFLFHCSNSNCTIIIIISNRYLAHGTTTDYMFDIARVPMAFTFEVFLRVLRCISFPLMTLSINVLTVCGHRFMAMQQLPQKIALKCSILLIFQPLMYVFYRISKNLNIPFIALQFPRMHP